LSDDHATKTNPHEDDGAQITWPTLNDLGIPFTGRTWPLQDAKTHTIPHEKHDICKLSIQGGQ